MYTWRLRSIVSDFEVPVYQVKYQTFSTTLRILLWQSNKIIVTRIRWMWLLHSSH